MLVPHRTTWTARSSTWRLAMSHAGARLRAGRWPISTPSRSGWAGTSRGTPPPAPTLITTSGRQLSTFSKDREVWPAAQKNVQPGNDVPAYAEENPDVRMSFFYKTPAGENLPHLLGVCPRPGCPARHLCDPGPRARRAVTKAAWNQPMSWLRHHDKYRSWRRFQSADLVDQLPAEQARRRTMLRLVQSVGGCCHCGNPPSPTQPGAERRVRRRARLRRSLASRSALGDRGGRVVTRRYGCSCRSAPCAWPRTVVLWTGLGLSFTAGDINPLGGCSLSAASCYCCMSSCDGRFARFRVLTRG